MKKIMKYLITFIGLGVLGMASAAPSLDCGGGAQPISIHSTAETVIKDS